MSGKIVHLDQHLANKVRELQRRLDHKLKLDAGQRRIVARALRKDGYTYAEISRITGVSKTQAWHDTR